MEKYIDENAIKRIKEMQERLSSKTEISFSNSFNKESYIDQVNEYLKTIDQPIKVKTDDGIDALLYNPVFIREKDKETSDTDLAGYITGDIFPITECTSI